MTDRRTILKTATFIGAAATNARAAINRPWSVIDTNVSLFQWPFRRLPLDRVDLLVQKLEELEIREAWAGSFEGILHRDLAGVNARLAATCEAEGRGRLRPFGSVNPAFPDWEEDLRRCHEVHRMPGIRLHPNYHEYGLNDPRFQQLLAQSAERGMHVQIAVSMEDVRTQHSLVRVEDVDLTPLPEMMGKVPGCRVQILNLKSLAEAEAAAKAPGVYFDTARVEATDGIAKLVRALPADRVLFGSHAPFFIPESALIKVHESELTEPEHRALFEQNARQLLPDHV